MLEKYMNEIYKCTRCGFCRVWGWSGIEAVCPVYKHTPGWETQYPRGRVKLAKAAAENDLEMNEQMVDHVLMCTLCGHCKVACPIDLPLSEIFQGLRCKIAEKGLTDAAHKELAESIRKYNHPFGQRRRHKYSDEKLEGTVDALYYPGCNANYNGPKIIRTMKAIFSKLKIDFHVVDEDACCGYPLYETGQMKDMKDAADRTLAIIKKYNPRVIITACPGCLNAFKNIYPEIGFSHGLKFMDVSEFLLPLLEKKLSSLNKTITWHDPCVLGRHLGIYEEPRKLIKMIPEINFTEMKLHHERAKCCGASLAMVPRMNEMSLQVAMDRINEVKEIGAEEIITSCPACYSNLKRSASFTQQDVKVKFITELINEVLEDE